MLPRVGVHPPEGLDLLGLEGVLDVRRAGSHAGGEAVGADQDLAGGGDELELHPVPLGKFGGEAVGVLVEFADTGHGVAGKIVAGVGGPGLQSVEHHVIIIIGHDDAEGPRNQERHNENGAQGADQPSFS